MPADPKALQAAISGGEQQRRPREGARDVHPPARFLLVVQTADAVAPAGGPHVVTEDTPIVVASMTGPGGERALPVYDWIQLRDELLETLAGGRVPAF